MENLPAWLLNFDTMILVMFVFGGFIAWELKSGEFPLRWFGSIRRDSRPFFYWIGILIHLAVFGVVVYAWMTGVKMPLSIFFE